jgi:hypothetical protein
MAPIALFGAAASYTTFASGCPGSLGVPTLTPLALPVLGQMVMVQIDHLPMDLALLFTGLSNETSPFGPLPIDLGALGMPGCTANVSPDVTTAVAGGGSSATWSFVVPSSPPLFGLRLYQQALVLDPNSGNPLGAVMSDAAALILGTNI